MFSKERFRKKGLLLCVAFCKQRRRAFLFLKSPLSLFLHLFLARDEALQGDAAAAAAGERRPDLRCGDGAGAVSKFDSTTTMALRRRRWGGGERISVFIFSSATPAVTLSNRIWQRNIIKEAAIGAVLKSIASALRSALKRGIEKEGETVFVRWGPLKREKEREREGEKPSPSSPLCPRTSSLAAWGTGAVALQR